MIKEDKIMQKLDEMNKDIYAIKTDVAVIKVENTNHLKHHETINELCFTRHNNIDKALANMKEQEVDSTKEIKSDIKDSKVVSRDWIKWVVVIVFTSLSFLLGLANYYRTS